MLPAREDEADEMVTEYYDPVAILLSSMSYNTENLTDELRKCKIKYNQLSGLVEEDLRLMGMTNDNAIKEILAEISSLSNQRRLYDRVLQNDFEPAGYAKTVIKNNVEHLKSIACMITLIRLKMEVYFPQNVILEDRFYATEFSRELCDSIISKIDDIQSVVQGPSDPARNNSYINKLRFPIIVLSGAIVLALAYKRFQSTVL